MARQSRYTNDTNITGVDRLTGIRSEDGATANYTLSDIAEYLAETGNADGSRLGLKYDYAVYNSSEVLEPGKIYLDFGSPTPEPTGRVFSAVRNIYVRNTSRDGSSIIPLRGQLAGGVIKLTNTSTVGERSYGLYRVSAAVSDPNHTDSTRIRTIHVSSSGDLGTGELTFSPFQIGIGVDAEGTVLRSGTQAPENNVVGSIGDFYIQYVTMEDIDTPSMVFGPKSQSDNALGWGPGISLTGMAARVGVGTTTTLTAGSDASVTNTGTSTNAVLNFGIPRGEQGIQGPAGPAGPQGPQGIQGERGLTGNTGPAGSTGAAGPRGDRGPAGAAGATGARGEQGLRGATGARGFSVLNGTAAPLNSQGENGDFWIDTTNNRIYGPKASDVWTGSGTSLIGPTGATGATGATGSTGPTGAAGNTVLNGTTTPSATDGVDGDFWLDTSTTTIYGPKASGVWPATGTSLLGSTTLEVSEDGSTVLTGIDCLKFAGSGISSVAVDPGDSTCAIVTIAGGGASVVNQVTDLAISQSGFNSNAFRDQTQSFFFNITWTAHSDITSYTSLVLSISNSAFSDITITTGLDGTVTSSTTTVTTWPATLNGRVTATLTYVDGDDVTQTRTATVNLNLNKTRASYAITPAYSGFEFTPSSSNIEYYDDGTISYTVGSEVLNSWTAPATTTWTETGDGSITSGGVLTIDSGDSGAIVANARRTYTHAGPPAQSDNVDRSDSYNIIRSFRYGAVTSSSAPTWVDSTAATFGVRNITDFNTGAQRNIDFGTVRPNGNYTITPAVGQYMYFVFDSAVTPTRIQDAFGTNLVNLPAILTNVVVGGYRIYTFVNPTSVSEANTFTIA